MVLVVFISSLLAALIATPLMMRLALRLEILDRPAEGVKVHPRPIPYLGGAAIVVAFAVPLATAYALSGQPRERMLGLLLATVTIFLLGLWDDLRSLSVRTRLIVQFLTALVLLGHGFAVQLHFLPEWLNAVLTLVWIMGTINAFNFIDIIDGLAGGIALIASLSLLAIAAPGQNLLLLLPAAALAGASLGFLPYNFSNARIYMGDAGSYVLGLVFAALALETSYTQSNYLAFFAPVIILWVPLFDLSFTTLMRVVNRRSVFKASNDHATLRFMAIGFTRKKVAITAFLTSIFLAAAAVTVTKVTAAWALAIYGLVISLSAILGTRLGRVKV